MDSTSIGAELKGRRTALGRSIDDLVHQTRIQPRFLEAIEADDLSVFPSIVFARNFVRQYALSLDVKPEPLLARLPVLDPNTVPLPEAPARPRARRTRLSNHPSWASAAWALSAAVIATGAYLYHSQGWHITLERRTPPDNTVKAESLPTPPPAPQIQSQPEAAAPPAEPIRTVSDSAPAEAPSADAAPVGPIQAILTARERVWIGVKIDDKSGYAWIGTLNPNDSRTFSASAQLRLAVGNAGGLSISLNGRELDSLGRHGQFRNVRLTGEGLEFLSKDPPPAGPAAPPAPAASAADPL